MKLVRLHRLAEAEALDAARWYRERNLLAAQRWRLDLQAALRRIAAAPQQFPVYLHQTRRLFLRRFPFFIVFLELDESIVVLALVHAKRKPGYWVQREKSR